MKPVEADHAGNLALTFAWPCTFGDAAAREADLAARAPQGASPLV